MRSATGPRRRAVKPPKPTPSIVDARWILEARDLTKRFELGSTTVEALRGVSLTVQRGEFVALMGPSGSGKSTLLQCLGGLDRPTAGEVVLDGAVVTRLSDEQATRLRREKTGFVFQFFNLIPTLSAEENVLLPALIAGERAGRYSERLDELLDLVGLTERRTHKPDELSGGEQQRVAIARALIRNPDIILADEPTGNLDSKTGSGVLDLLKESAARYDQTILMVTHDPRAAATADRVVFLSDGQVVDEVRDPDQDGILERIKNLESAG
jgi:putative ABC transport system ATP-binding protein